MHGIDFSTPDSSVSCLLLLQESLPSPTLPFPSEVILLEVKTDFYLWQHLLIFLGCYFLSFQVSLSLPLPQWSSGTTVTSDLLGWLPCTLLTNPVSSLACLHGLNSSTQLTITLRPCWAPQLLTPLFLCCIHLNKLTTLVLYNLCYLIHAPKCLGQNCFNSSSQPRLSGELLLLLVDNTIVS